MKHMTLILAVAAIACLAGCKKNNPENNDRIPIERKDIALTKAQQGLVQAGNDFAFNLYRQVLKQQESSFMVSPLSIEYALSMLCNGAVGTTQAEILTLLGYEAGQMEAVNSFCKYLTDALYKVDNTVKINIANALIANTAMARLKEGYISTLVTYYDALAKGFNFSTENAAALSYINNWAKEQTNGMIPKLLDDLSPSTYAMLMNAIYFKGIWSEAVKFDAKNTKAEKFTREDKTETSVDYMNKQAEMGYAVADGHRMVGLPYGNGAYQMVILLPDEGNKLSNVAASVTGGTFRLLKLTNTTVKLKLPKFETENTIQLNEILRALGMQLAFTDDANFSAMAEDPLLVSRVFQKAKIKVDEKGSEAAAVTVIDMKETSVGPGSEPVIPEFYATRPFMYLIREISTGAILFMGKYDGK
ncbi:MAG: serpin family protein [Bacteroidales bacterium]|nr:serpin family protein [Bacteroidales bacterium]